MDKPLDLNNLAITVVPPGDWPVRPASRKSRAAARRGTSCTCANCDAAFAPRQQATAFCGLSCKSEAEAVRYGRAVQSRYGSDPPEDIAYALKMKIAHALGGGYRATARRLSPARRVEVVARDAGRCVLCGKPGEEIDHIDGDSDELNNLRYRTGR